MTFKAAYQLIDNPYKFIHGDLARDKKDRPVDPCDKKATKFDILGALTAVHHYSPSYEGVECVTYMPKELEQDIAIITRFAHKIYPEANGYSLGPINDLLTFDDMRDLFSLMLYGAR